MNEKAKVRIRRLEEAVGRLARMRLIYLWGGARGSGAMIPPTHKGQGWSDCSGFVQYILAVAGIKLSNPVGSTWSLAEEGSHGEGDLLTLFIKNPPGDEHVIVRHRKRPRPWHFGKTRYRWSQCGGSDNPQPGGGPSWFIPGFTLGWRPENRIREFPIKRNFDKEMSR